MESNPLAGLLGLLMLLQLIVVVVVLLGGLYALFCLNRAASGLDRLASAVENWVAQAAKLQAQQAAQNKPLPGQSTIPVPPTPPTPPVAPDWIKPIELSGTAAASKEADRKLWHQNRHIFPPFRRLLAMNMALKTR